MGDRPARVQYADVVVRTPCNKLHLPYALTTVTPVLLQNVRACRLKPSRKLVAERLDAAIQVGTGFRPMRGI